MKFLELGDLGVGEVADLLVGREAESAQTRRAVEGPIP